MPARKGGHEVFAEIGKTGVDKRCDERYNLSCVCGRSSSGRARPCQGRGSEFEPRRPLQKETPSDRMVFLFGMPRAGWNSLPRPARSASNPEVKAGLPRMALPFVGCREASSSLVYFAAQSTKNKETPSDRMAFLFGMPRAGWNTLPRPARSASNPEVKAGLPRMALPFVGCREASSSLVYFAAQSAKNKEKPPFGWFFFLECRGQGGTRCLDRRASADGLLPDFA